MRATNPIRVTTQPRPLVGEMAFLQPLLQRIAATSADRGALPFVTLSYAQSVDGSIAAHPSRPVALSSESSLKMAHVLRSWHCALLVGINTVLTDDPRLTVRLCEGENPQPIILDSHLRMPEDARLFAHPDRRPMVFTTTAAPAQRIAQLQARGASIRVMPPDAAGRVDINAVLRCLAGQGVRALMVEGGATIIGSFLRCRLVDYCVITVAPKLMFGGLNAIDHGVRPAVAPLAIGECGYQPLGGDLIIHGRLDRA